MPEAKCTCPTVKGPRMYDNPGFKLCPTCTAHHEKYFPAFPGDPSWRLNHGAIDRNGWGILPGKIATRDIEKVSDLQMVAAHLAFLDAYLLLFTLEGLRDNER